MMITIHGFPPKTKYQDVKILIKQECNITDFILDNLINDTDGMKKVRIGLADNTEGFKVMKCLDGYRMPGNFVLKARPVGKAATNQPQQDSSFDSRPNYQNQSRNDYSNAPRNDYMSQAPNDYNNQGSHGAGAPLTHGGMHGSVGPHGPRPSQGGPHGHGEPHTSSGPQGSMDARPSPWVSGAGNNSNQWNTPMAAQVPQNTFGFNSPQGNVNQSYGQQPHQSHSRPGFNQSRAADQAYGYMPKNVPEVVPANSRYRWVKKADTEPKVPKTPQSGEDSPNPSSVENFEENSQDLVDYLDTQDPTEHDETSNMFDPSADDKDTTEQDETSNTLDPSADNQDPTEQSETSNTVDASGEKKELIGKGESPQPLDPAEAKRRKKAKDAKRRENYRLRNINNLNASKRKRLYFWLKQGKTFLEARELCEIRLKNIPEYPAAKQEKILKARSIALRKMSPERQAREMKLDKMVGRVPGAPPPVRKPAEYVKVRIVNKGGRMSKEEIEMIQDKLLELVDAETEGNGPNFVSCFPRCGYLAMICANAPTFEWLENHFPELQQLWEGANLDLINLNVLDKPVLGIGYVPDTDLDDETILRMLKTQNKGIDFSDWGIVNRTPESSGQTVIFKMNKLSAEKLVERKNIVYIGLNKTKIRIKKSSSQQGMQPPKKQLGNAKWKANVPSNQYKWQKDKGPKGKTGNPPNLPKFQKGYGPKEKMNIPPKGPRGMAPMNQVGMGPMNSMGMGPMGPMDMGPMGPMGPMGMGPIGPMGPMGPMGMGPMGPMGMGPMGPMDMASMGQMDNHPLVSSYSSGYSKPKRYRGGNQSNYYEVGSPSKHYGGDNQPKYYGGGNQSKYYGGGNQSKYYGGGNQSKYYGGGNQSKYYGGGNQSQYYDHNQPNYYGGGNQPKYGGRNQGGNQSKKFGGGNVPNKFGKGNQQHFEGGKNPQKNKNQGGPANNRGSANNGSSNPEQAKPKKKISESKAQRRKERKMAFLTSQKQGYNQEKKPNNITCN